MAKVEFQGNLRTSPVWAGDFGGREHIMPFPARVDPTQFTDQGGIVVTATANAAANATAIAVTALTLSQLANTVLIAQGDTLIPAGTVLNFGSGKFALVNADAKYGATSLSVAALDVAINSGDTATFSRYNQELIPSGTLMGRTTAEQTAGALWHPWAAGNAECYLSVFDIANARANPDVEFYRPGGLVKINFLPNYANLSPAVITQIQTIYRCITGVN